MVRPPLKQLDGERLWLWSHRAAGARKPLRPLTLARTLLLLQSLGQWVQPPPTVQAQQLVA
jgi:hypothetical protein